MKIDKIYNNNVIQTLDPEGREVILMGRGLGFGKKIGDDIAQEKIEKTFVLEGQQQDWQQLYGQLSEDDISLVMSLVNRAEEVLGQTFEMSFYLAFADHLQYAIERTREGLSLKNPLAWEVRKFYPTEYQLGRDALDFIAQKTGVQMDEDEAASLALHFVNAQKDSGLISKNQQITKIVMDILGIVRLNFGANFQLDDQSINYNRFVTHVNYFAQRVVNGLVQGTNDAFLYEQVQNNYPQAYACTQKIAAYILQTYDFEMSQDEEVYLTIHLQRLTAKTD